MPLQNIPCALATRLPDAHQLLTSLFVIELHNALGLQHVAASASAVHGMPWHIVVDAASIRPLPRPFPPSALQNVSSDTTEEQGSLSKQHTTLSAKEQARPPQEVVSLSAIN